MSLARSGAEILLSFTIAIAITGAFVAVGAVGAVDAPVELSADERGVPAPFDGSIAQTGSPPTASAAFPQFEEVSAAVGFEYEPAIPTGIEVVNSGVYVTDFSNDGHEDVLAVGERYPVLFQNVGGEFIEHRTFEHPRVQSAHFFDYDNDGYEDLLLAQYGGELIFYHNDRGHFVREDVGFDRRVTNPSSIVSADFTGDGCLDVFVTQNGLWSGTTPLTLAQAERVQEGHPEVRPQTESGSPNLLYFGDCERFTDVTAHAGIEGRHWSLTGSAADFTGDGFPDVHVGNDWSEDFIYENEGDGTFTRRGLGPDSDRNAMSSNAVDMNGDHALDLFVTNIYYDDDSTRTVRAPPLHRDASIPDGNNYFVNDGSGNFTDRATAHGLDRGGWGWTATVADVNNDGHLDVVQTTTDVYWVEPYSTTFGSLQVWNGTHDSWVKLDSRDFGLRQSNTYSIARIDYDNDGDLDVIVGTAPLGPTLRESAQPFKLYENQHAERHGRDSLQLFVRDRDGVGQGASVYVETDRRTVFRPVNSRGNFQTQDSRLVHVGLANEDVERVTVLWPDGTRTEYATLEAGNRYVLTQEGVERIP